MPRHAHLVAAFGAGVHRDDDDVGVGGRLLHEPAGGRDVGQRLRPLVGREAEDRDLDVTDLLVGDLTGPAGGRETLLLRGRKRLRLARRAVVVGVVVREVHHRESGLLQPRRIGRRRLEGVTVRAARPAFRAASDRERAFEVAEDDVAGEIGLDVVEERAATVRRQVRRRAHHDVARGGDRDDAGRGRSARVVLATVVVVVLTASGFDAAFAFSATGAGVPSTSSETTNATAMSAAPALRTSANGRTGAS